MVDNLLDMTNKNIEESVLPSLKDFVRIPNLSRNFDSEWASNGLLEKCADHLKSWAEKQDIKGLKLEIIPKEGSAPLLYGEIDRTDDSNDTILFYGHYDKQPHFNGWRDGLSPCDPVQEGDRIYGRGVSDDGYCFYSSLLCIKQCQTLGKPHPRCIITVEGEEESGSPNFMSFLSDLDSRIGSVDLVIVLDSGAISYDQMWMTTSLRGMINIQFTASVLEQGMHSGLASGIVASPYRIVNQIIDRLQNSQTGECIKELQVNIPANRYSEISELASYIGPDFFKGFNFFEKTEPVSKNVMDAIINGTWKSQLTVTGLDGLPGLQNAGNVIATSCGVNLSIRTPPTLDCPKVLDFVIDLIESNPPYNCTIKVNRERCDAKKGYNAADLSQKVQDSLKESSKLYWGNEIKSLGVGGSIPLLVWLQEKFPTAQFIVTGVLGPDSNAHSSNEMLHVPTLKKITAAMTKLLIDYSQ